MREWLALAMVTVGVLIVSIGTAGANIAGFHLLRGQRVLAGDKAKRDIATLEYASSMLVFAMIAVGGIVLLLVGEVIGFGVVWWAPALPGGLLVAVALVAAYMRWLLRRLRDSL